MQGLTVNASQRAIIWPGITTDIPVDTTYDMGNLTMRIVTIIVSIFEERGRESRGKEGESRKEGGKMKKGGGGDEG